MPAVDMPVSDNGAAARVGQRPEPTGEAGSAALLDDLLARVREIAPVLAGCIEGGETERTLPAAAVGALANSELFRVKAPRELGGFEAPPSVQFHVLAALAEISSAAAWCTMVNNTGTALLGVYLSDEGCAEVFSGPAFPKVAGIAAPTGTAKRAEGGYLISGRWRFASGIRHSDWVQVSGMADTAEREVVNVAAPTKDVDILDTWHVFGLRGTGSCDIALEEYFVPERRCFVRRPDDPASVRRRGGALFALPRLAGVTYEHAGIAYGFGRRALALLQQATDPESGHPGLAARGDVLAEIGRMSTRLAAAGTWVTTLHDAIVRDAEAGIPIDPEIATTAQSSACLVTEVAVDCCTALFRHSGARGLYVPNETERLFRDVNAAAEHVVVGNHVYLTQARIPYADVERR